MTPQSTARKRTSKLVALTGAVIFVVTACAGTAPNAVQKGFPAAKLHPLDKPFCHQAEPGEDCTTLREQYRDRAASGLADDGFIEAKTWEAYETRKVRREENRNRGN